MKNNMPYSKYYLDQVAMDALRYAILHGDKRDSSCFTSDHVKFDTQGNCNIIARCTKALTDLSKQSANRECSIEQIKLLSGDIAYACTQFSAYRMHPHVVLFLQFCDHNPLYDCLRSIDAYPEGMQEALIAELKCQLQDKCHLSALHSFHNRAEENYHSYMAYCNEVLFAFKTILVIRLDVSLIDNCTSVEEFDILNQYKDKFLACRRRNKTFKDNVGHIWRLEYSPVRGYYYHFVFMFDGSVMHEGKLIPLGKEIERCWNKVITKGAGECSNHYLAKEGDFNSCYVGVRQVDREEDLVEMEAMVSYLTKRDKIITLMVPGRSDGTVEGKKGFHLLGRGKVGKLKKEEDYHWRRAEV